MTERKKGNKMIYGEPTVMLGGIKSPVSKKPEVRERIYREVLDDYLTDRPAGYKSRADLENEIAGLKEIIKNYEKK